MYRGGLLLPGTAALLLGGCASQNGIEIRAHADPLSRAVKHGDPTIAEARGLLALGSVALASEAFRKVLRTSPDDIEALAGLANCYERMGRFDLARTKYERALALAPTNQSLLSAYAASLRHHGLLAEAAAVTDEASSARASSVSPTAIAAVATATPAVDVARSTRPEAGEMDSALQSLTVRLPPARPAPAAKMPAPPRAPTTSRRSGSQPRLVRLSAAEVALITANRPAWTTEIVRQSQQSVTVRFVRSNPAVSPPVIRLLNAARRQGLAARTREALLARGWRGIDVGDSKQTRARSLVLYPADRQALGRRLAAEFGFRGALNTGSRSVVILLGRDVLRGTRGKTGA